jgi:hypothetical protein
VFCKPQYSPRPPARNVNEPWSAHAGLPLRMPFFDGAIQFLGFDGWRKCESL